MIKIISIFLLGFFVIQNVGAQDTLPKISVTQLGKKVLVSWVNDFNTVTTINIQRSGDSTRNFTTIGSVIDVKAKSNGFVDTKEFLPNNQYYRVFIAFEGGNYIFTKSSRAAPDTLNIVAEVETPESPTKTWFVPSSQVYTGRDNNVIIALNNAAGHKYSVKFYEEDGTFLFELKNIRQNYLTLDKVNFVHAGLFQFELFDNRIIIERHKVYIPKDGVPVPSLDVNGHEIQ